MRGRIMAACRDNRRHRKAQGARRILRAAIAAAPLLTAAPALAQWLRDQPIPLEAVVRIVRQQGFAGFSPPRLEGDVYVVHAVGDGGARVRLVIDAYDGRILRPLGAAQEFVPPRSMGRPGRRGYPVPPDADDDEEVVEREFIEPLRGPRLEREELVPPRSIGRAPPLDREVSRGTDLEVEREIVEPYRPPIIREQRSAPTVRGEPAPERRTTRIEQPAPEVVTPAQPAAPRGANRSRPPAPAATAAPAPVEGPKLDRPAQVKPPTPPAPPVPPTTTAAVPAPTLPKETTPVTPAAPARPSEPAKPEASRPGQGSEPQSSKQSAAGASAAAAQRPAEAQGTGQNSAPANASAPPKVRIIEGVTPVLPQSGESKPQ